jgi:hypothetical protein
MKHIKLKNRIEKIKVALLSVLALSLVSTASFAEGTASTGGGKFVRDPETGKKRLLDRIKNKINIDDGLQEVQLQDIPGYSELRSTLAIAAEKVPGFDRQILKDVEKLKFSYSDKPLPESADECLNTSRETIQAARRNGSHVILSRKELQDNEVDAEDKAGLILHEILLWKESQQSHIKTRKCTTLVQDAVEKIMDPDTSGPDLLKAYYTDLLEKPVTKGLATKAQKQALFQILNRPILQGYCKRIPQHYTFTSGRDDDKNAHLVKFRKHVQVMQEEHDIVAEAFSSANKAIQIYNFFDDIRLPNGGTVAIFHEWSHSDPGIGSRGCLMLAEWFRTDSTFEEIYPDVEKNEKLFDAQVERDRMLNCIAEDRCYSEANGRAETKEEQIARVRNVPKEVEEFDFAKALEGNQSE